MQTAHGQRDAAKVTRQTGPNTTITAKGGAGGGGDSLKVYSNKQNPNVCWSTKEEYLFCSSTIARLAGWFG